MTIPEATSTSRWYGPAASPSDKPELLAALRAARAPEEYLSASVELFKIGDFSSKPILFDLVGEVRTAPFAAAAVRVLQSVCTHDDLRTPENMTFLVGADPSVVQTFASGVWDTQSWEIAPYLLALAEEWADDHEVSDAVRFGLDTLSGYTAVLPDDASVEEIGDHVARVRSAVDPAVYSIGTEPTFPGLLAKRLARAAMTSATSGSPLTLAAEPSLLSIWTGVLCPVDHGTVMDDAAVRSVLAYIDGIAAMEWTPGTKDFYGHPVG